MEPTLLFQSKFVDALPVDRSGLPGSRQVKEACASLVSPTPVSHPALVGFSDDVGAWFGITRDAATGLSDVLAGNRLLPGMVPYAACYGGHQFGNWAGQLGDGRAMSLGELPDAEGRSWEIQLKGAGPTPYSRGSDGRAVLRSSLREFLCSEAMFHLGVPTTRALSLVTTGDEVVRDMFYDGHAQAEPGAIVCRVAPSFLRFGSFQIHAARGDVDTLRKLAEYTLRTHFPELGEPSDEAYVAFVREVCRRTALLVVHWMRVGFVHGVLNTDNMSIHGLTIDYGPYGFLEPFDFEWTPNTTDAQGKRYAYGAQPEVCRWNLVQLARAILPLLASDNPDSLGDALKTYGTTFNAAMAATFRDKLGLSFEADVEPVIEGAFRAMSYGETDMTLFFRGLDELP